MSYSDLTTEDWQKWVVQRLWEHISTSEGGQMKPARIGHFYSQDFLYKEVITANRGLKAICTSWPDHFKWYNSNVPGYEVVEARGSATAGLAAARATAKASAKAWAKASAKAWPKATAKPAAKATAKATAKAKANAKASATSTATAGTAERVRPKTTRVQQLAATFAVQLPDYVTEQVVTREELKEAWECFCTNEGEATSGFSQALFLLRVRWHVLAALGGNRGFKLLERTEVNFKKRVPADRVGALEGEPPKFLASEFESPVDNYFLPGEYLELMKLEVYSMQQEAANLLAKKRLEAKEITDRNYKDYLHSVLYVEELQMKYDISLYDRTVEDRFDYDTRLQLYKFDVPGLAEKRPSVLRGDKIMVTCKQGKFVGYVYKITQEQVAISMNPSFRNQPPFTVHFDFNRTPLRTMHRAIDDIPRQLVAGGQEVSHPRPAPSERLNEEQATFIAALAQQEVGRRCVSLPLLLWGPPGTGKTHTVVHAIYKILQNQRNARILVCAPSNPASDLLCERLAKMGVKKQQMLRLVAAVRNHRDISDEVFPFTHYDTTSECFKVPKLSELMEKRVIVSTCTTAAYLRSRLAKLESTWFTHVFVDEAAQAMEAEVLIPLSLRALGGLVCLIGDFKQLGPVIRSPVAIKYGLGMSLMERVEKKITVDHLRCFTLLKTYRAHPSILQLYNKAVYGDMLHCKSSGASYQLESWDDCPVKDGKKHPVIFHHCDGEESRSRDSPSWKNEGEIKVVKQYLMKLLAFGVKGKDIGIISPYHKQCQGLRYHCMGEDGDVEVGTTELFQGREKRAIIISTVRSKKEDEISSDFRFTLGFLGNFKRTNVAVSRAMSILIVVGNMSLLSNDFTWHNIIKLVKQMNGLRGGSFKLKEPKYGENSEWSQTSRGATQGSADGVLDRPWRDHM